MTLTDLIATCRLTLDDTVEPYLWSTAELTLCINEAQAEAATRAQLIVEEDNATYCTIAVVASTSGYPLHAKVLEVKSVYLDNELLKKTTLEELNESSSTWKTDISSVTRYYVSGRSIKLVPTPTAAGALSLVVTRLPVTIVTEPEIHSRYHIRMLDWVYRLALLKRDADAVEVSPDRPSGVTASTYEAKFEKSFGPCADARVQQNETNYRQSAVNHWVI